MLVRVGNVEQMQRARATAARLRHAARRVEDDYGRGFQDGYRSAHVDVYDAQAGALEPAVYPIAAQPAAPVQDRMWPLLGGLVLGIVIAGAIWWLLTHGDDE